MAGPRFFFIMDAFHTLNIHKDSTLSMMLASFKITSECYYLSPTAIYVEDNAVKALVQKVSLDLAQNNWYQLENESEVTFSASDIVLQRKDPPFDMHYIYVTYLLELAEKQGAFICNNPRSLRDCNEKLYTAWFPELCPPTLITSRYQKLKGFIAHHKDTIIKPLDGMGGSAIFRIKEDDPNLNVILETLTEHETTTVIMQRYIPEIKEGDKRILLINGEPIPYSMNRIPPKGETRANLAVGGTAVVQPLSTKELEICKRVSPELKKRGLYFVGLDVIGDYVTEINVTSPTGIRQIENETNIPVGQKLIDELIKQWKQQNNAQ